MHFHSKIHSIGSWYLIGNIQLLFAISLGYSFILFYVFLVGCVGVVVIYIHSLGLLCVYVVMLYTVLEYVRIASAALIARSLERSTGYIFVLYFI